MLCGVTATLGSNPSATATAARPQWGRAVLLCRRGVRGLLVTPLVGRAALCARGRRPARSALFVAPLVFRAPEGPAVGPGCLVCPWAAARPRAVRAASFARRVASKPGQAPPPPTGTAARPLTALRRPSHQWGRVAVVWFGVSSRSPARPRRRPSISHVIPLRLVQTLNWHHWNCNVFGVCRKMTTINYVRNLGGGGVVAARGHRRLALSTGWPGCLIPPSPFRAPAEPRLKPSLPLRVRNGCFWCSFRVQR